MNKKKLNPFKFVAAILIVIVYKFAWPWTPWWADVGMIFFALIFIPFIKQKKSETKQE